MNKADMIPTLWQLWSSGSDRQKRVKQRNRSMTNCGRHYGGAHEDLSWEAIGKMGLTSDRGGRGGLSEERV